MGAFKAWSVFRVCGEQWSVQKEKLTPRRATRVPKLFRRDPKKILRATIRGPLCKNGMSIYDKLTLNLIQ